MTQFLMQEFYYNRQIILFIPMIVYGQKTQNQLTEPELYKAMLKQLMGLIKQQKSQYSMMNLNQINNTKTVQDVKEFNSVVLLLKNQASETSKPIITNKVLFQMFKLSLGKQSIDSFDKNFRTKFSKYIQPQFSLTQVINLVKQFKVKTASLDEIAYKLKSQESYDQLSKKVQILIDQVQQYQKIITEISKFPEVNNKKAPPLSVQKKKQLFEDKVQQSIDDIYLMNNYLHTLSLRLTPFRQPSTSMFEPKQIKDIFQARIFTPLSKLISMPKKQSYGNGYQYDNKPTNSSNSLANSSDQQKKWAWMKNLLIKISKRQDLDHLECKQTYFQPNEKQYLNNLIVSMRTYRIMYQQLVQLASISDQVLFKNHPNNFKAQNYVEQKVFGQFKVLFDVAIQVCQSISSLPIVKAKNEIFIKSNKGYNGLSILDEFQVVRQNLKGDTQKWYYQLAYDIATILNIFGSKNELTYENMAKERRRFIDKIEQMNKQLLLRATYQPVQNISKHTNLPYYIGGKKSQSQNSQFQKLQQYVKETTSKNQKLFEENKNLKQQFQKAYSHTQQIERQLLKIKQLCIGELQKDTFSISPEKPKIIQSKTTIQFLEKLLKQKKKKKEQRQIECNKIFVSLSQLSAVKQRIGGQRDIKKAENQRLSQELSKSKQIAVDFQQKLKRKQYEVSAVKNQLVNKTKQFDIMVKNYQQQKSKEDGTVNIEPTFQDNEQETTYIRVVKCQHEQKSEHDKLIQAQEQLQRQIQLRQKAQKTLKQKLNQFISKQAQLKETVIKVQLKFSTESKARKQLQQKYQEERGKNETLHKNQQTIIQNYQKDIKQMEKILKQQQYTNGQLRSSNQTLTKELKDIKQDKMASQSQQSAQISRLAKDLSLKQTLFRAQTERLAQSHRNQLKKVQQKYHYQLLRQQREKQYQITALQQLKRLQIEKKVDQITKAKALISQLSAKITLLQTEQKKCLLKLQQQFTLQKTALKAEFAKEKNPLEYSIKQLQKQIKDSISKNEEQIKTHDIQVKSLHNEIIGLNSNYDQLQDIRVRLDKQLKNKEIENDQYKQSYEKSKNILEKQLQRLKNQNSTKLQQQKDQFQEKLKVFQMKKQKEITQKINEVSKIQNNLTDVNNEKDKLQAQNKELNAKIEQNAKNVSKISESLKKQFIVQYSSALKQLKQKTKINIGKIKTLQKGFKESSLIQMLYFDQLFQGQTLQNNINFKIKLCQHLKQLFKDKTIIKTKLLFKYDNKNPTNFHEYIDGKSKLLLVLKTKQQFYIAGFYSGTYQNKLMTDPSMLICLNKDQSYVLYPQFFANGKKNETTIKAMQYNKDYIMFGNSEIRIKAGEGKIFSNFGINNSFFNNRGKKWVDLLGTQKNQTQFQSYQLYQVQFADQLHEQLKEQRQQQQQIAQKIIQKQQQQDRRVNQGKMHKKEQQIKENQPVVVDNDYKKQNLAEKALIQELQQKKLKLQELNALILNNSRNLQLKQKEIQQLKHRTSQLQAKQSRLQTKNSDLQTQKSQLQNRILQLLQLNSQLQNAKMQLLQKQSQLENAKLQLTQKNHQLQHSKIKLFNKNQQLQAKITNLQIKKSQLQKKQVKLQKRLKQLNENSSQKQIQIKRLKQELRSIEQKLDYLFSQKSRIELDKQLQKNNYIQIITTLQNKLKITSSTQAQINIKNTQIKGLKHQVYLLKQYKQAQKVKYKVQNDALINSCNYMKQNHLKQCDQLKNSIKEYDNKIKKLQDQHEQQLKNQESSIKSTLQSTNSSLRDKIQSQVKENYKQIIQKRKISQEKLHETLKFDIMNEVCDIITKKRLHLLQNLPKNCNILKETNLQEMQLLNLYYYDLLFQGQLLKDKINDKIKLCQHIKKLTKDKNILRTKLMYKYDKKNTTSFHEYIDNQSNLLLIVRTKEQYFIAGFYSGVYENKLMTEPGILICLNHNESYVLNTNQTSNNKNKKPEIVYKAMQYDKYYIIFGNAEIRIKSGQRKLFSNVGVNSAYYNSRGKKWQDFLGTEKNQTEFQSYQIYKIQFDDEVEMTEEKRQFEEQKRQQVQAVHSPRRQ